MKEIHTNFSSPRYSTRIYYGLPSLREVLDIRLKLGIVELGTNKTFGIEKTRDQVLGEKIRDRWMNVRDLEIHTNLVFRGVAD
jgi:hypothetical protein